MWATNHKIRHFFGSNMGIPIALCGVKGKHPLNYLEIKLCKCERCRKELRRKEERENGSTPH